MEATKIYTDPSGGQLWQGSKITGRVHRWPFTMLVLSAIEIQPLSMQFPSTTKVVRIPLDDDGPLPPGWTPKLFEIGKMIAEEVKSGGKVLVTCNMGINRSGLVTGHALYALGIAPRTIVPMIKGRRSIALQNQWFVSHLERLPVKRSRAA